RIAVRRSSGYRLDFPVTHIVAATVRLHDPEGRPLPVGAAVTVNDAGGAYVGWDGIVYLERLLPYNRLTVRLPDGSACAASFNLDVVPDQIARIGPLTCEKGPEP
ncbi:MAG: FimD/PapC C-terminal domain-containing protein, partial [Rhodospirillaceae bacterium]|nr:FimD/PapC C-terminal domain-containing protein [Rhodospirillaceae bacterium]